MDGWLGRREVLWTLALVALLVGYLATGRGHAGCDVETRSLHAAAGHGESAVPEGREVAVRGVVTGDFTGRERLGGFFMEDPGGDADQRTALFVYAPRLDGAQRERVRPGAELVVHGETARFHGRPQIAGVERLHRCGEPGVPEPLELALPVAQAQAQRLEGRLVRYPEPLTVIGNYQLGRFGTLELAPERRPRGRSEDRPQRTLLLDDGRYTTGPDPVPYLDADSGTRRAGDRVEPLVGIVTHAFDRWRLHPVEPPAFDAANPRPEEPPAVGGTLRIATYNLENYFLSTDGRGAESRAARERQARRLGAALEGLDADLLGLVEFENDRAAVDDLLDRLDTEGGDGAGYRAVHGGDSGDGAIRVNLAYRPDRLELRAGPWRDTAPVHDRPPQAAVFEPDGGRPFLAVVVHFKAKVGCPDRGDVDRGQGCWNQRRQAQAQALVDFARDRAEAAGVDDVALVGDFNSYAAEDPIRRLRDAGFRDPVRAHTPPPARYTFVYRGGAGTLDYTLVNRSMAERVTGAAPWAINADEPRVLGYDGRLADAPAARGQPFRSSDHDPVLLGID